MDAEPAKVNTVQDHFSRVCAQAPPPGTLYPVVHTDKPPTLRFPCDYPVRIVSADRSFLLEGRMVDISFGGTTVAAAFPPDAPTSVILHDLANNELYECEVVSRSEQYAEMRFVDILGPVRRRKFLAGETIPLQASAHGPAASSTSPH